MERQNYIIGTYLTSAKDIQRGVTTKKDDFEYFKKWYLSIIRLGLKPVILHDNLSAEFQSKYPKITFIQCDSVPKDMHLYDYRWVLYYEFMLNNECDNVFFTDISDVIVIRDPFYEILADTLYCGDETETLGKCEWMHKSLRNDVLCRLQYFSDIISSDKQVLNCGIFGGSRDIVGQFLYYLVSVIELVRHREKDGTVDMSVFNYVAYRYFDFKHGAPVNSEFKKYEKRNDVWFIHK